jgi:hypothetical protein
MTEIEDNSGQPMSDRKRRILAAMRAQAGSIDEPEMDKPAIESMPLATSGEPLKAEAPSGEAPAITAPANTVIEKGDEPDDDLQADGEEFGEEEEANQTPTQGRRIVRLALAGAVLVTILGGGWTAYESLEGPADYAPPSTGTADTIALKAKIRQQQEDAARLAKAEHDAEDPKIQPVPDGAPDASRPATARSQPTITTAEAAPASGPSGSTTLPTHEAPAQAQSTPPATSAVAGTTPPIAAGKPQGITPATSPGSTTATGQPPNGTPTTLPTPPATPGTTAATATPNPPAIGKPAPPPPVAQATAQLTPAPTPGTETTVNPFLVPPTGSPAADEAAVLQRPAAKEQTLGDTAAAVERAIGGPDAEGDGPVVRDAVLDGASQYGGKITRGGQTTSYIAGGKVADLGIAHGLRPWNNTWELVTDAGVVRPRPQAK